MGAFRFPSRLYPIVDFAGSDPVPAIARAEAMLRAGVRLLQIRYKGRETRVFMDCAREIGELCRQHDVLLLVNDRPDIAVLAGAAGVHLGQDDLPPHRVRAWLPAPMVIGWSTHNEAQARAAAQSGVVDYIGVGPIFPTATKENPDPVLGLEGLRQVRRAVDLPIVAIGGITPETAPEVIAAGADAVAMIGAIARSNDPERTVRSLLQVLDG